MATVTTYLLVSGPESVDVVEDHPVIDENGFQHRETTEEGADEVPRVRFEREDPLEDRPDLSGAARAVSSRFPEATVALCEAEVRFEHVERFRTELFRDGKRAGKIEHGYVFNVGGG
jgi:hypothetical protein